MNNERVHHNGGEASKSSLDDVRAFYRTGQELRVTSLPAGTARVVACRATGEVVEAELGARPRFSELSGGTYSSRH